MPPTPLDKLLALAQTSIAGITAQAGDAEYLGRMEHLLQQTGYWRAYQARVVDDATPEQRGAIALELTKKVLE